MDLGRLLDLAVAFCAGAALALLVTARFPPATEERAP